MQSEGVDDRNRARTTKTLLILRRFSNHFWHELAIGFWTVFAAEISTVAGTEYSGNRH
jgi:hypothetical protein